MTKKGWPTDSISNGQCTEWGEQTLWEYSEHEENDCGWKRKAKREWGDYEEEKEEKEKNEKEKEEMNEKEEREKEKEEKEKNEEDEQWKIKI